MGRVAAVDPGGAEAGQRRAVHVPRVHGDEQPLARLAMAAGGAAPGAHPWTAVERECTSVTAADLLAAHVQVRVGSRPA